MLTILTLSNDVLSLGANNLPQFENKLPFAEGASIHWPPMFSGVNYQFWKVRMNIFIEFIDRGIWNAIVNDPYIPVSIVNGESAVKPYH